MRRVVERVPIPFCGVALAVAALGPLLETRAAWAWLFCGALSCFMMVLAIAKIALSPHAVAADLGSPVLAGVAGTFPMALLNLSTYLARLLWVAGFALWVVSLALFAVLIARFTVKFARGARINDLTPAYFVIYVGALAASTTAPTFGMQAPGLVLAEVGLAVAVALVVLVTMRVARSPLPEPLKPMMCIYAAPPSMCLAAYLSCVGSPSMTFAVVVYALSCAFYLFGLANLAACLRLRFYPTYAAMTFPFVIAAAASLKFASLVPSVPVVAVIASAQIAIACLATLYVLVRYTLFLCKGGK